LANDSATQSSIAASTPTGINSMNSLPATNAAGYQMTPEQMAAYQVEIALFIVSFSNNTMHITWRMQPQWRSNRRKYRFRRKQRCKQLV
jgi:hypothetical protein